VKILNDVVFFALELVMLVAYGIGGWYVGDGPWRYVAAVAVPLAVIVVWSAVVAPRASRRLRDPLLFVAQLGLILLSDVALIAAGAVGWGVALAVVAVIVVSLDRKWGSLRGPDGES
jgi:hypothetical protein